LQVTVTAVSPATRRRTDVLIDADPRTPIGEIAVELGRLLGVEDSGSGARLLGAPVAPAAPAVHVGPGIPGYGRRGFTAPALFVAFEQLPGDLPFAGSPIRAGVVVSVGDPSGCASPEPAGVAEIHISGGPAAGTVHRLPFGQADIGSRAEVMIGDPSVPPLALRVFITPDGFQVGPFAGITALLDRRPFTETVYWEPGQQVAIGGTLLDITRYEPPDVVLKPAAGILEFDRPPRRLPPARRSLDAERLGRRYDCPDPAAVLSIATGPRRRLWERRRTDPDYLLLRTGTADLPGKAEMMDERWLIPDVPVTISLSERAVAGLSGPANARRAAGHWLAAQIAVLHSPEDVRICVLTDETGAESWAWTRWLPHCRGQDCVTLVGNDTETVAARIAELQTIITARYRAAGGRPDNRFGHDIVVVFDGSGKLRALPGVRQVLREGPLVGVYSICLDAEEWLLPAECRAVAATGPDGVLTVRQLNEPAVRHVRPEYVTQDWCDLLARSLAPVRDVSRPLDAAGLRALSAEAIAARWERSTTAVLGESPDGPFAIDLRREGPDVLIASLAVANRPDAMNFVLVDYLGGGAFKECAYLPHTVGMVTSLDPHLARRALTSMSAELARRERIHSARQAVPLPQLVIVVDGLAALARDLPEFVTGLVDIAERGRSLGIHLILGPRRPGTAQPDRTDELADLKALVGHMRRAAARLGIPAQRSPWLVPLPATLLLSDALRHSTSSTRTAGIRAGGRDGGETGMVFCLTDLPGQQRQEPTGLLLSGTSHLLAAGAPRSGRSTLLRTIAASIAISTSIADVHLYGIDCGDGALLPLADLPHCGAVVTGAQRERVARLLRRLVAELRRRQVVLADNGHASITEQRGSPLTSDPLPHIVVLLDGWEGFTATLGEATDIIIKILAEGASAGIHLIMTGGRSLLTGRIAAMCEDKLTFKLADKDDYILAGLRPCEVPDDIPPGRAFRAGDGAEVQVALLTRDSCGPVQAAALREIAAWAGRLDADVPASSRPFRVDPQTGPASLAARKDGELDVSE
jgi:DNA segregation ATPase FtsK/SpoIIIE-like protein